VAYEKIADCLYERLKVAREQCSTLTKIRDAVLPRLISGKLRISDEELESQT
jgi:type I restriction enzyme S subunit